LTATFRTEKERSTINARSLTDRIKHQWEDSRTLAALLGLGEPHLLERAKRGQNASSNPNAAMIFPLVSLQRVIKTESIRKAFKDIN